MGGGVVKVLILQFFEIWEMVCTWSHKSRLSRILQFRRDVVFFQECFFCLAFWKIKQVYIYIDFDACIEFCIILLYILPYVHICIYIHTIWQLYCFFKIVYVSRKICIWYWTDMSAISSCEFCIFWKVSCILSCCSWVLFTKEHVQIEHALFKRLFNYDWI